MNWKTPVTMVFLVLVLIGGTMVGWHFLTQEAPSLSEAAGDEPAEECTTYDSGQALETGAVTVNVYNTSGISGFAGRTMTKLVSRGFVAGTTGDSDVSVPRRTVLLTSAEPSPAQVRLVRAQLKGKVTTEVAEDPDIGTDVNMFVGKRFEGFVPEKRARSEVKVKGSTRVCFQVEQ